MNDKNNNNLLMSPSASYGRKVRLGDIVPIPMENAGEKLRSMGYISHEELVEHLSKFM